MSALLLLAATAFAAEIALWRAHGGDYGYRLIVARPE